MVQLSMQDDIKAKYIFDEIIGSSDTLETMLSRGRPFYQPLLQVGSKSCDA